MIDAWLRLVRISSFPTAPSDVLAGFFLTVSAAGVSMSSEQLPGIAGVAVASMFLYWAGLVGNDLVDLRADRRDRPRRPIASGVISPVAAVVVFMLLTAAAVALGFSAGHAAGIWTLVVAGAIVAYDLVLKRSDATAALGMAACRGLNLVLGAVVATGTFAVPPLVIGLALLYASYIGALTVVGRYEARPAGAAALRIAARIGAAMPLAALFVLLPLGPGALGFAFLAAVPLGWLTSKLAARSRDLSTTDDLPQAARAWVRTGVLGILLWNGGLLVGAGAWWIGALVCAWLPAAMRLGRRFSPS